MDSNAVQRINKALGSLVFSNTRSIRKVQIPCLKIPHAGERLTWGTLAKSVFKSVKSDESNEK
jgi:hypothetical protein